MAQPSDRLRSLDGLRGIAAVVVVLGHARLVIVQNQSLPDVPGLGLVDQAIGIMGMTAVWLFFVLSGFVLARMFAGTPDLNYGRYVLQRLARLYLPVWAALIFAIVTILVIPRTAEGLGAWVDSHPSAITAQGVVTDAILITGNWGYVTPLWSLRWEVLFSLILVLYVRIGDRVPPLLAAAGWIAVSAVGGAIDNRFLLYMPMFGIGVAISAGWQQLTGLRDSIDRRVGGAAQLGLAVVTLGMLIVLQWTPNLLWQVGLGGGSLEAVGVAGRLISVTGIVLLVALSRHIGRAFTWKPILWLGMISFSLYLTHEIVLLAATYPTGADPLAVAVAVLVCFPVAWAFYRLIESRTHGIARRFGQPAEAQRDAR